MLRIVIKSADDFIRTFTIRNIACIPRFDAGRGAADETVATARIPSSSAFTFTASSAALSGGGFFSLLATATQGAIEAADPTVTDPVTTVVTLGGAPQQGETWTIRGSNWLTGRTPELRTAWRDVGSGGKPDLGFRIARYAE